MTNRLDAVHVENEIELPWPIESSPIYDKNMIGQCRDRSYRSGLCPKIETELLRPIWLGAICDDNQTKKLLNRL